MLCHAAADMLPSLRHAAAAPLLRLFRPRLMLMLLPLVRISIVAALLDVFACRRF